MTLARVGIGSNVGDSSAVVLRAIDALSRLGKVRARSGLFRSRAWGVRNQPDFINAVVLLDTALHARPLLAALKELEKQLGRLPTYRWGPRAIDLDILTYGNLRFSDPELTLPHRHLFERAFVLVPLAQIDAQFATARDALPRWALDEVSPVE